MSNNWGLTQASLFSPSLSMQVTELNEPLSNEERNLLSVA